MKARSPTESYLAELRRTIRLAHRRRVIDEVRTHLSEAAAEEEATGVPRDAAERLVVERFGPPELLAERFAREVPATRLLRNRVVGVAALAALASSVAAMLVFFTSGSPSRNRSVQPAPSSVVSAVIPLRPGISGTEVRDGTLWVESDGGGAAWGGEGLPLIRYRIDENQARITEVVKVRTPESPRESGTWPNRVRAFGSLWVNVGANRGSGSRSTRRLDPRTGAVLAAVDPPELGELMAAPAPLRQRLWVAYGVFGNEVHLRAIDPAANRYVGRTIVIRGPHADSGGAFYAYSLHAARGSLWLVTRDESEEGARVWRVDPDTGSLLGRSLHVRGAVGVGSAAPAWDGRWLWLFGDYGAYRIDLAAWNVHGGQQPRPKTAHPSTHPRSDPGRFTQMLLNAQPEQVWANLFPADQRVVDRERFVSCAVRQNVSLEQSRVVHRIGAVSAVRSEIYRGFRATVVTVRTKTFYRGRLVGRDPSELRLVGVGTQWRWLMDPGDLARFRFYNGCP